MLDAAAVLCLATTLLFIVVYSRFRWFDDEVGRSIMASAASLAGVPGSILILRLLHIDFGRAGLSVALLLISLIMIWRTTMMIRFNREASSSLLSKTIDSEHEMGTD